MNITREPGILSGFCGIRNHDRCRGAYAGYPCTCDCHQPTPEPQEVTVHCHFGCPLTTTHTEPTVAHAAMESHYRAAHWADIRTAIGWVTA